MSNYLENTLINHIFRGASFSKPNTLAVALVVGAVNDAHTGSTIPEVVDDYNYARQIVSPSNDTWAATSGSDGLTSNLSPITFPEAGGDWGNVTGLAVVDSAEHGRGNVLFYGNFDTPSPIGNGEIFTIEPGALAIGLD